MTMPEYLIALSIGPVQGFIAAARRTRDLWFGSFVLSEVSKAAALEIHRKSAILIFPAPQNLADLQADSDLNVGNKLMASVLTDDPADVIEHAKGAARDRWRKMAEAARQKLDITAVRKDIWQVQLDDVLELFGAWVPVIAGYSKARARLEQLLAARKMTRDFQSAAASFDATPGFGLPKSSLDAARETVLEKNLSRTTRRQLGLGQGEQLDCPALVKRLGGDPEQFPPVTRIALEAWLKGIAEAELGDVKRHSESLVQTDLATRVKADRYKKFPFDGAILFPSRVEALGQEVEDDEENVRTVLRTLKNCRQKLYERFGEPTPYFAVLVADGDRMGAFIDSSDSQEDHVNVTRALAGFAAEARGLVENSDHRGACVYAGGDDVLALLPVDTAVSCAHALQQAFENTVASLGLDPPTLSVGLGLGHVLTPFARLLDLGRRAEKFAKEGPDGTPNDAKRNALAIIVGVRSGAKVAVRGRWGSGIHERLRRWMTYYQSDQLSDKTPYDLFEAVRRVVWARDRSDYAVIAMQEIGRVLKKKRAEAGTRELSASIRTEIESTIELHGVNTILAELRVARWLAQKAKE